MGDPYDPQETVYYVDSKDETVEVNAPWGRLHLKAGESTEFLDENGVLKIIRVERKQKNV